MGILFDLPSLLAESRGNHLEFRSVPPLFAMTAGKRREESPESVWRIFNEYPVAKKK